jgi:hypothetical protein
MNRDVERPRYLFGLVVCNCLAVLPPLFDSLFVQIDVNQHWSHEATLFAPYVSILLVGIFVASIAAWKDVRIIRIALLLLLLTFALMQLFNSVLIFNSWLHHGIKWSAVPGVEWWRVTGGLRWGAWSFINWQFFRSRRLI